MQLFVYERLTLGFGLSHSSGQILSCPNELDGKCVSSSDLSTDVLWRLRLKRIQATVVLETLETLEMVIYPSPELLLTTTCDCGGVKHFLS